MFSPLTQQLINALRCLPGIGNKSAQRMAFHLLGEREREKGHHLAQSIQTALEKIQRCTHCQTYTEQPICDLCTNPKRNKSILCIVETPADIIALEQTHCYQGQYFVLHGHLSPLDGIGPDELNIPALLQHIQDSQINELTQLLALERSSKQDIEDALANMQASLSSAEAEKSRLQQLLGSR